MAFVQAVACVLCVHASVRAAECDAVRMWFQAWAVHVGACALRNCTA